MAVRLRFAEICGVGWFAVALGGEGLIKDYDLHGYRRGGTFDSPKVPKSDLGLRPKNPTHRNARPERLRRPGAWAKRCL